MASGRIDRHRAVQELRQVFKEWDPLGLAPERDLLSEEYNGQVGRTLAFLERGAEKIVVVDDLTAWLDRARPPGSGRADLQLSSDAAAERMQRWWQEFLGRPRGTPEPPVWGSLPIGALLLMWLAVIAGSIALRTNDPATILADGLSLVASVGSLAFALLPAAAILGAPKVATTNPPLLAGSIILVLSRVVPGLLGGLTPFPTTDSETDLVGYQIGQAALTVLGLSLLLVAVVLLVAGLRRLGADPGRWVLPTVLLVAALVVSGYAAAFVAYGELWVEWATANLPGLVWALAIGWLRLFAAAAVFVSALAGVRARLSPRSAWLLAALGFGAWLLAPVASTLSFIIGQAAPELGGTWIAGYLLGLAADIALPVALLVGLGGGGATPPWLRVLRDRWLPPAGQAAAPTA